MKRIINLIFLLLLMIATIILCVLLWVTNVHPIVKVILSIVGVVLTIIIFKVITKINNEFIVQLSENNDEEVPVIKEEKTQNKRLILCPKCYQAWDGNVCFHCGFSKKKDDDHQN